MPSVKVGINGGLGWTAGDENWAPIDTSCFHPTETHIAKPRDRHDV